MSSKFLRLFPFVLFGVLAAVATVSVLASHLAWFVSYACCTQPAVFRKPAPPTSVITNTGRLDKVYGKPIYSWEISQDEQDRLSLMFGQDFYDTSVEATLVTAEPNICPYCGKETEFIDW